MELKKSKIFNKETMQSVSAFCESQEIKDVDNFIYLCFKQGFDIKRYGFLGGTEQEKIVEVPVEKVVTKIEYIRDENSENELGEKITKLEKEMSKKDEELDKLRRTLDEHLAKPPIEKIVELVVEKEITDNSLKSKLDALQNTLTKVRQETLEKDKKIKELELTIQEIQKFQENKQAVYLKGSNLDDKLYK